MEQKKKIATAVKHDTYSVLINTIYLNISQWWIEHKINTERSGPVLEG